VKKFCALSALLLTVVATVSLRCRANDPGYVPPRAEKGVLDLRNIDLSENTSTLKGEWGFYWKQLVSPANTGEAPAYVKFPELWRTLTINGEKLPSQGYATYTLTVLLPANRPTLALEVPDTYCSYELFVNDSLMSKNGVPAETKEKATPFWSTNIVVLPQTADTLRMVMHVANFWHYKGGPYKNIVIGEKEKLVVSYRQDRAFDLVLAGCLFMGGLFFFGFFLFGHRDKAILYFSLFCIVYSYRMVGTSMYALHWVFPQLDWFFTVHIEYLCLVLAVALFSRYIRHVYPQDAFPPVVNAVTGICVLYALLILTTPPSFFTRWINFFLIVMFLYIGYAFYVCIRAVRYKRVGATFALISCGVMLMVFLIINLHYFRLILPPKGLVFAGYVIFFFLQSLVLSYRFAFSMKKATHEARQGLRAKTEFLSTMSHEIRTPLNVVIGMTHLLLRNNPRKEQEENLNVLLFSANNLLSIVNDILDYNKIEAGKINFEAVPMDINSIARHIMGGLQNKADEKQIDLVLETENTLTRKVSGDPTRLSQVIYNLVHNAIKFTEKGSVKLSIQSNQVTEHSATLTFYVTDTGIGIAPDKQKMIFERFTQADSSTNRSYGGTGLGLAIIKGILSLQGVSLQLKSQPGKGSVFYFTQTFPLTQESVQDEIKDQPDEKESEKLLDGISILVVEDNPFNVMVAKSLLEQSGAQVDIAGNGVEALQKVAEGKFRMVLMDLNMPVMDGFEAPRELRRRGESLPIIALTASLPAEVEKEVRESGLTDIVVKPFNPDELFRVILPHLQDSTVC
jgi:signal transduction histidine kinase/ActR/RegA family two-component response regulator